MRARELARPYPTVSTDDDAAEAARLVVRERLPALLVLDQNQYPYAIVPGARVVQALVPAAVQEDPLLAAVIDDRLDNQVREAMAGQSVATWLPRRHLTAAVVGPAASPMQIAALMARKDTPIVAVVERNGVQPTLIGAVTTDALIEYFIGGP
ncbi:CBS domain-containing protein [Streptomyces sp. NBC_00996]|uniref:CBS domain-containing protein n=1 Tax=Streptomyces sp. NBC_00996 TaxID=2903710 RepID=UPI00386A38E5|nr:CBS domain-containing protein [Streptomyces sp. NBC_00996]